MKITSLTQSDKNPGKYCATFEDGTKLAVTVAQIADYGLFTGRELDEDAYAALVSDVSSARIKARALKILGKRSMSRREITGRLVGKGESEKAAEETADWLERIGAVNDAEYAELIVRHYAARGYGKARVKDELYRRGIGRELWDDALEAYPETDEKIDAFLRSRLSGRDAGREALKRAADALYRRGFSWDEISSAVERYKSAYPDQFTEAETGDFTDND